MLHSHSMLRRALAVAAALAPMAASPALAGATSVTPGSLDFGSVNVLATSAGQTLTVTNTEDCQILVAYHINPPATGNPGYTQGDYSVTSGDSMSDPLGYNQSRTYTVTFTPTAAGPRPAEVDFYETPQCPGAPVNKQFGSVSLSGVGVAQNGAVGPTGPGASGGSGGTPGATGSTGATGSGGTPFGVTGSTGST